jgi:CRP-like cAMP-binding protein
MYDRLYQHISRLVELTDEEFAFLKTLFIPKKLRRKQYLLQDGDVNKYIAFVDKGLLRIYTVDDKGTEHIVQFALEGWWASDMYSYLTGEASYGTTSKRWRIRNYCCSIRRPTSEWWRSCPKWSGTLRLILQNNYVATHRRLMNSMSQSAEEKYKEFVLRYPAIVQRVPQHMIASYLGITPAFLSRIRGRKPSDN